jgi:hypothetical protein
MIVYRRMAFVFALGAGLVGHGESQSNAASLVLDTGKSAVVTAGTSTTFGFSTTNADAGNVTNFYSWTLGVQILPTIGSTGTLSVGTLTAATTNPMPVGGISITQPTLASLGTAINGSTNYYSMGIETTDTLGTLVSGSSYNLGLLTVNASVNATGTWNVYAVQQNTPLQRSYWTDETVTDVGFGNLAFGQGNVGLLLGTITAVPEPRALASTVAATCLLAAYVHRTAGHRRARS